ncbi:MAG TPA: iron-sulfur cluster assembly protein [Candidatus Kryptonia bacterium]|nr:iron-sulfur cluster assembly protein [Candidatus Kryptonia bacterium]
MEQEPVEFSRDCEAIQIPQGITVTIPKGTSGIVTQALGDTYTLQIPSLAGLFRINDRDADAIGKEPKGATPGATAAPTSGEESIDEEMVWNQLRDVYDPEIPVNVVDLGLIYDLRVEGRKVLVQMTLTAQGCGMGPSIAMDAKRRIESLPGVEEADVQVVWDPPWSPHMISAEGKERLGMG